MKITIYLILFFSVLFYQNCSPFESSSSLDLGSFSGLSSLKCESGDPRVPVATELGHLSKLELSYVLEDLFKPHMNASQFQNFQNSIQSSLENMPDEEIDIGMNLADRRISAQHVERLFLLSEVVADFVSSQNQIMSSLVGSCYTTSPDSEACRRQFLTNFGLQVLRRPMAEENILQYLAVMSDHANPYRNVMAFILNSPLFYYHVEAGAQVVPGDGESVSVNLNAFERASKLSFYFLKSFPDQELLAAAQSGALMNQSEVQAQVERLMTLPKVRERLTASFTEEYLRLAKMEDLKENIDEVKSRLSEIDGAISGVALKDSILDEAHDYMDYMLWEQKATFREIMSSDLVFPRNAALAKIYGTRVWNGSYDLPDLVRAPANERSGLMTQTHFLFTGSAGTRPIMRGVHVYRNFLCGTLNPPPNNDTPEGVVLTEDMTDQEYVRAITEVDGTACVGCHKRIINPIGFSFDNFDAFGKFRTQERVFQPEGSAQSGTLLTTKPLQTQQSVELGAVLEGDFTGAVDMARYLSNSARANACFVNKVWNFAQKQLLDFSQNPCAVQAIYQNSLAQDKGALEVIKNAALQPEFMKRTEL